MGQFSSSRLKKNNQDPGDWVLLDMELMMVRLKKMGIPIDNECLTLNIMDSLHSAYGSLMENLEDWLDSIFDPLTMSILGDKLSEKYEKIKRRKGTKDHDSDNEDKEPRFVKTFEGR